eukprot:gnl/Chilomastix_cuspidata/2052.p1 GENE.gnl/Chilomastix_cuspidata/2052~~gnl/Chilomastix_cuspidata/2052.p1  ORF type:complete len:1124 (+),score=480.42 gnl/Chilomastix_cuspidata/2052:1716-5087(+)
MPISFLEIDCMKFRWSRTSVCTRSYSCVARRRVAVRTSEMPMNCARMCASSCTDSSSPVVLFRNTSDSVTMLPPPCVCAIAVKPDLIPLFWRTTGTACLSSSVFVFMLAPAPAPAPPSPARARGRGPDGRTTHRKSRTSLKDDKGSRRHSSGRRHGHSKPSTPKSSGHTDGSKRGPGSSTRHGSRAGSKDSRRRAAKDTPSTASTHGTSKLQSASTRGRHANSSVHSRRRHTPKRPKEPIPRSPSSSSSPPPSPTPSPEPVRRPPSSESDETSSSPPPPPRKPLQSSVRGRTHRQKAKGTAELPRHSARATDSGAARRRGGSSGAQAHRGNTGKVRRSAAPLFSSESFESSSTSTQPPVPGSGAPRPEEHPGAAKGIAAYEVLNSVRLSHMKWKSRALKMGFPSKPGAQDDMELMGVAPLVSEPGMRAKQAVRIPELQRLQTDIADLRSKKASLFQEFVHVDVPKTLEPNAIKGSELKLLSPLCLTSRAASARAMWCTKSVTLRFLPANSDFANACFWRELSFLEQRLHPALYGAAPFGYCMEAAELEAVARSNPPVAAEVVRALGLSSIVDAAAIVSPELPDAMADQISLFAPFQRLCVWVQVLSCLAALRELRGRSYQDFDGTTYEYFTGHGALSPKTIYVDGFGNVTLSDLMFDGSHAAPRRRAEASELRTQVQDERPHELYVGAKLFLPSLSGRPIGTAAESYVRPGFAPKPGETPPPLEGDLYALAVLLEHDIQLPFLRPVAERLLAALGRDAARPAAACPIKEAFELTEMLLLRADFLFVPISPITRLPGWEPVDAFRDAAASDAGAAHTLGVIIDDWKALDPIVALEQQTYGLLGTSHAPEAIEQFTQVFPASDPLSATQLMQCKLYRLLTDFFRAAVCPRFVHLARSPVLLDRFFSCASTLTRSHRKNRQVVEEVLQQRRQRDYLMGVYKAFFLRLSHFKGLNVFVERTPVAPFFLPVLHGTDLHTATQVARRGFSALSAGEAAGGPFYKWGPTFTTSYEQASTMAKTRVNYLESALRGDMSDIQRCPCVVVAVAAVGALLPSKRRHFGKPVSLKSGFTASYSLISKNLGKPISRRVMAQALEAVAEGGFDDTYADELFFAETECVLPFAICMGL